MDTVTAPWYFLLRFNNQDDICPSGLRIRLYQNQIPDSHLVRTFHFPAKRSLLSDDCTNQPFTLYSYALKYCLCHAKNSLHAETEKGGWVFSCFVEDPCTVWTGWVFPLGVPGQTTEPSSLHLYFAERNKNWKKYLWLQSPWSHFPRNCSSGKYFSWNWFSA